MAVRAVPQTPQPSKSARRKTPDPLSLRIDGDRLRADFDDLSLIGATSEGGLSRLALSNEDWQARLWLADRIEEASLTLHDDDAANLGGVLTCDDPDARTLLIGSHLDSVPDGGRFDGAIGVLAGLECLRVLRQAGIRMPVHVELIDFTDDEGTWHSLFGARAVAGLLPPEVVSDTLADNISFSAALARVGLNLREVTGARRDPARLAGYLELHIEHGTRLETAGRSIGIVTDVVGRTTYEVVFHGEAGHSGTTDMTRRRDALRGAAQFIVQAHEQMRVSFPDGIFNCGDITVEPGKYNIIPSKARLTVECRHVSEALLGQMEQAMMQLARQCAATYDLTVDVETQMHMPAAPMAAGFMDAIELSAETLGLPSMRLVSYAGHAAQMLSQVTPSGMIFIPSVAGIGHSPAEFTRWNDVIDGANTLLQTILRVASPA